MDKGIVRVICGSGCGKTSLALGCGMSVISKQKNVIMIQFLKGNDENENMEVLKRLEPDFKLFRFEKADGYFDTLSQEEKKEEEMNIRNGFNFAKKVAGTGECDLLILDEILGAIDYKIVSLDEIKKLLESREDNMSIIMTGKILPDELKPYIDVISRIENVNCR